MSHKMECTYMMINNQKSSSSYDFHHNFSEVIKCDRLTPSSYPLCILLRPHSSLIPPPTTIIHAGLSDLKYKNRQKLLEFVHNWRIRIIMWNIFFWDNHLHHVLIKPYLFYVCPWVYLFILLKSILINKVFMNRPLIKLDILSNNSKKKVTTM